jgi:hypothetical protein
LSGHAAKGARVGSGPEVAKGGKGSHRKFTHPRYPGAVTVSGKPGDDAKAYQEKQVKRAIEVVDEGK